MIDSRRWTEAERAVIVAALERHQLAMQRQARNHSSGVVRNRALWHAYEAERICAEIDGR